jgi:hypothetical protein
MSHANFSADLSIQKSDIKIQILCRLYENSIQWTSWVTLHAKFSVGFSCEKPTLLPIFCVSFRKNHTMVFKMMSQDCISTKYILHKCDTTLENFVSAINKTDINFLKGDVTCYI